MLGTWSDYKDSKKKPGAAPSQPPIITQMPQPVTQAPRPAQGSIQQLFAVSGDNPKKDAQMKGK